VGYEVARALGAQLDVFVVRKLGAPTQPELAMGAIASGGVCVMNEDVVHALRITQEQIDDAIAQEARELQRRELAYRGDRPSLDVADRCVLLVDDGIATGYTMRAAVEALRRRNPKRIIVAVPVAARSTCAELRRHADTVICLMTPFDFAAVGQWYLRFEQTTDDEVRLLLQQAGSNAQHRTR
jgi:putative phosphoribosyl transferase